MSEQQDWTRAYLLMAKDGSGNIIPLLVDASGQMYALLRGIDALGAAQTVKVDDLGQLYTVLRGASGVDVGVDANGFLTAVLKGELSGVLTTIAVDDAGRLQAFMLDNESQWGNVLKVGNSELAARLGGLKTWDWRGSQFWAIDFSRGTGNMISTLSGTGAAIALSPVYWYSGGYSLKMTGGSTASYLSRAQFYIDHPPSAKCGLEIVFSGLTDYTSIAARFSWYKDNKVYHSEIQNIPGGLNNIKYLNSGGTYTVLGNNFEGVNVEMWNHMKIVADISTFKYLRALWGETEVDLSGVDVYQYGTGYLNQIIIQIDVVSRSGNNDSKYIDSVLFTVNEP